ncbi:hypothetical protein FU139_32190 [Burkholderia territorii]|nr:hypothetical protein FU139_32190 [Burkholderia territorii]
MAAGATAEPSRKRDASRRPRSRAGRPGGIFRKIQAIAMTLRRCLTSLASEPPYGPDASRHRRTVRHNRSGPCVI